MKNKVQLSMRGITKQYPGVLALDDVSLDIYEGETHALVGENGAGKSTFIKVLAGAIVPDEGVICIDGKEYSALNPMLADSLGIEVIYQEFNLMPSLSVAENIFMGHQPKHIGIIDFAEMDRRTREIFNSMGVDIDPRTPVSELSMAYMQLVEIAKALAKDVRILIMDEPTAPLTINEVEVLFKLMERLHGMGVTIIYISHRLNEIFRVSDRLTIIRDGQKIGTYATKDMTRDTLIQYMVGRKLNDTFPRNMYKTDETVLSVQHLSGNGVEDISIEEKACKNSAENILPRIDRIQLHWTEIKTRLKAQMPSEKLRDFLNYIGCPAVPSQISVDSALLKDTLMYSKEVRNRYTIMQLAWDLGLSKKLAEKIAYELY